MVILLSNMGRDWSRTVYKVKGEDNCKQTYFWFGGQIVASLKAAWEGSDLAAEIIYAVKFCVDEESYEKIPLSHLYLLKRVPWMI